MSAPPARPTVLGFDFGLRRIGVAVGNSISRTAEPLVTLQAHAGQPDWAAIAACIREWQPAALVVGVPYNDDGSLGELAVAARQFAAELTERHGLVVHPVDEHLSSREAEESLRERRRDGSLGRQVRHGEVDREAARLLVLQWLRAQP